MEERQGVTHHVMDHVDWTDTYDMQRFAREAQTAIDDILRRGKVPIIIGGTHYYLQNLLFHNKTVGAEVKRTRPITEAERAILDGPGDQLWPALQQVDPVIAEKFHPQDHRKLRRALEIYYETGAAPSQLYRDQKLEELEQSSLKFNSLLFWVYSDREVLVPRLDARVDKMMASGARDEIREMYQVYQQSGASDCTSGVWQVIGFKEFLPWLESGEASGDAWAEGIERMKSRTRQYAKYQVKWIKRLLGVELQKEARFNWVNGGKMYLLDATDLSQWSTRVRDRGVAIASEFIARSPITEPQAPPHLEHILPSEEYLATITSGKTLEGARQWKHFQCDICKDSHGNPLVSVGEEQHRLHMKSRRHRSTKHKLEKQRLGQRPYAAPKRTNSKLLTDDDDVNET
ncbi:hypothetical protein DIURU_005754 [Diutina rugosa]|uniref:tRNA dimethylallyltransferase n=1 Tax=Diutina rugosa TaxID=5481 RepID=A0A642UCQ3_DIURU|nr:uncharacterized protein DIURU_005754 [Diutina rugosa]KAA8896742.1 hypothetical protein DIURU_005754 [Diutina rugosa]